jgi:bacteriocin-like protein
MADTDEETAMSKDPRARKQSALSSTFDSTTTTVTKEDVELTEKELAKVTGGKPDLKPIPLPPPPSIDKGSP